MSQHLQQSDSVESVQEIICTDHNDANVLTTYAGPGDKLEMTPKNMTWEDTVEIIDLIPQLDKTDLVETSNIREVKAKKYKNLEPVPVPRLRSAATRSENRVNLLKPSEAPKPHPRSNNSLAEQETMKSIKKAPTPSSSQHSVKDFTSQGSRRLSVGDWSIESGRTSQSDNRSYREKLKERIQTVKERAGTSVTKARLQHSGKYTRSPAISRIQELLHKEEIDVEKALERHEEMKIKWHTVTQLSLEIQLDPGGLKRPVERKERNNKFTVENYFYKNTGIVFGASILFPKSNCL